MEKKSPNPGVKATFRFGSTRGYNQWPINRSSKLGQSWGGHRS